VVNGEVLPCVFALLKKKDKATYKRMWAALATFVFGTDKADDIAEDGVHFFDFEPAAYLTAHLQFRFFDPHGCFFHFKQALFKQLQALGFQPRYTAEADFRERFCCLGALAFLPATAVCQEFAELRKVFKEDETTLLDYFARTWVGTQGPRGWKEPLFPLELWNCHDLAAEGRMLTTNAAERYHNQWGNYFGARKGHPSLFACLKALEAQQVLTNKTLAHMARADYTPKQSRVAHSRVNSLKELVLKYDDDGQGQNLLKGVAGVYVKT
jgi:hypothetical protein